MICPDLRSTATFQKVMICQLWVPDEPCIYKRSRANLVTVPLLSMSILPIETVHDVVQCALSNGIIEECILVFYAKQLSGPLSFI